MNRYYVYRMGEAGDTFDADSELDALGKWVKYEDAAELQRQAQAAEAKLAAVQGELAQMTRERDHFKAMCELADALRNKGGGS